MNGKMEFSWLGSIQLETKAYMSNHDCECLMTYLKKILNEI
jgi:hypothetical protein